MCFFKKTNKTKFKYNIKINLTKINQQNKLMVSIVLMVFNGLRPKYGQDKKI